MAVAGNAYGQREGLSSTASSPMIQQVAPNAGMRLTSGQSIGGAGSASLPVNVSSPGVPRPDARPIFTSRGEQSQPEERARQLSPNLPRDESQRQMGNYVDLRSGAVLPHSPPPQGRSRSPDNAEPMSQRGPGNLPIDHGSLQVPPLPSNSLSSTGPAALKSKRSAVRSPPAQLSRDERGSMSIPVFSSSSRRPLYAHTDRQGSQAVGALPSSRVSRMGGIRPVLAGGSHTLPPKGHPRGTPSSEPAQSNAGDDVVSNNSNMPENPRVDSSRASSAVPSDAPRRGTSPDRDPSNRYILTSSSTPSVSAGNDVALEQTVVPALGQFPGSSPSGLSEEDALRKQVKFAVPSSTSPRLQDGALQRRLSSGRKQSPTRASDQGALSLPGLLTLPEDGPEGGMSTSDAAMVAGLGVDQYLDMRIAKIRGIVDWRINDVSRVIQHAEDAMTQQLENERRTRQDSVAAVRQLAETQKLIIEASVDQQKSRIDSVMESMETCLSEVKNLSSITGKNCDDIMLMQTMHNERVQNQAGAFSTQQMELLEKRLQCEIDVHKAAMSQTVAKERQRIDALCGDLENRRAPAVQASSSTSLSSTSQDSILRLGSVQADHTGRLDSIEQTLRSVQVQADAMHRLQQSLSRLEVTSKFDHDTLERLSQRADRFDLAEGTKLESQDRSSIGSSDERIAGLASKLGKHDDMIEGVKRDMKMWESLLTDYVMQAKERADRISMDIEKMKSGQPALALSETQRSLTSSPSTEALEATLEGRLVQLTTRLDSEQGERRDAVRRLQNSLNDLQTMQHNNAQEIGTFRSQLQLIPDRCREISQRLDDEVRDRGDAMSSLKQEMSGLQVLLKSATPNDSSRLDALVDDISVSKSLERVLGERMDLIDAKLKQEENQRQDAFEALRRDLERIPSVVWETISAEKGRIDRIDDLLQKVASKGQSCETDRIDNLTGQLDTLKQQQSLLLEPALAAGPQVRQIGERYDKMQESIQKLETEHQIRENAFALIERTMGQSEAALQNSVVEERKRIDRLAFDVQGLRGALESISPGSTRHIILADSEQRPS